jgi:CspA family cold shock protein
MGADRDQPDAEPAESCREFQEFVPDPTLKDGGVSVGDSMSGTVRWFKPEKGYGRIIGDDGYIYWVHFSAIQGKGYRELVEGQRVSFIWNGGRADFGRKTAEHVRLIDS